MKASKRVMLLIASVLTVFGAAIVIIVLSMNGFDLNKFDAADVVAEEIDIRDEFESVVIDKLKCDVTVSATDSGISGVFYRGSNRFAPTASVDEDFNLVVEHDDRDSGFNISKIFNILPSSNELTIYISEAYYDELKIDILGGDINISGGFSFESVDVKTLSGDITVTSPETKAISVETNSGSVSMNGVNCEDFRAVCDSGEIYILNSDAENKAEIISDSGSISLMDFDAGEFSMKSESGDISFISCDADKLTIISDSGDIEGTLRSEKKFKAVSDSGYVNVPSGKSGGECTVKTNSGDILISLSERE
ncbi:MAG: DUF4097 domain-containing protein [Clostridiales bacterium]|nr:DUF4097 domain-containing protein [Clostridiales bacterium]